MSLLLLQRERAARLERWAGTAMHNLMRSDLGDVENPEAPRNIARAAWAMAVAMEDERTKVVDTLRPVPVTEP